MNKIKQNKKLVKHTLIMASIVLLVVISLQVGFAATNPIDNTTAGGISGVLNSSSHGDTIELDEGMYTGNNNTNITINKNITIQGKSKDKIILDAKGLSRIFTVNNLNVTFINITFINTNSSNHGGAILGNNPILTFINCTFINNTALDSGGGIYISTGNLTIIDSTFTNNTATYGGGVSSGNSDIDVINCIFTNNTATYGGGAYLINTVNNNHNVDIINSTFTDNTATSNGGGIYTSNNVTIIDSTFTGNTATNNGGGVYLTTMDTTYTNSSSDVDIIGSTFIGNTATNNGGGLYARILGNNTTIDVVNSVINGNSAGNRGASVFVYNVGTATGNVNIFESEIIANGGDGVYNDNSNLTISGSNVSDNTGNGITTGSEGNSTITDNEILDNGGHGVSNNGNSTIGGNTIKDNGGSGIYNNENATVIIENNTIVGNIGVSVVNSGDLTGSGNTIDYRTSITIISTSVSFNKVTISVRAVDDWGNVIVGATINFYVNGKLVGSAITNNGGIAQFTYNVSSSGLQSIIASMPEFNNTNTLASVVAIHLAANTSKNVNVVLEKGTIITVSVPTINEGKKTNIKVTLKDTNGNILKNKKISLKIEGKTYTATTNSKGIAVFKIAGLKGGKHTFTVKFAGDKNYKASNITKIQKVNPKSNLAIISIKKLSTNKRLSTCKVTIANKGSLKSKTTTLALFHIRKGVKIKTKYIKIKSIGSGKKISIIVSYFPDKANHRYCKAHFQVDPKNKNKEIILANNKRSISLKH